MADTPESKVKRAVNKVLAFYPESYVLKPVQYGYGPATLDYIICHYGLFITVETKRKGGKPTPRQELVIAAVLTAGGVHFTIDDTDKCFTLKAFLEQVKQNATSTSQSQAPDGGSPIQQLYNQLVPLRQAIELWRRAASTATAPPNGDLPPEKDGV